MTWAWKDELTGSVCSEAEQYGVWSLALARTHDAAPPPASLCSSPVYFTGLVPAAIFPIGGAVPALILGERYVGGGRRAPGILPALPSLHGYPPRPCPMGLPCSPPAPLRASRWACCPLPREKDSLSCRPLLGGLDTGLGFWVFGWGRSGALKKNQGWPSLDE